MTFVTRAVSKAVGVVESAIVANVHARNAYSPLFVVGAPRSGTTVVMQHIVNTIEFGYFPNRAKENPRACITYGYLARRRYSYQGSYDSAYGVIDGPMAPSDGWDIFHRWFPRYDLDSAVKEDRLHELRTIVRAFEKLFDAPFANKNNANSLRIGHLRRLFPDAYFVHLQRDLCDTVVSVLKSREAHSVPEDEWWGIAPPRFYDRQFRSELERVVYQTVDVERYVVQSLQGLDPGHLLTLGYEPFCRAPGDVISWLESRYAESGVTLRRRAGELPESFRCSTLPREQRRDLESRVDEIVHRMEMEER